jgi:dimethylargininase
MSVRFKNALVRKPSKSISTALSSIGAMASYNNVCSEHTVYINALRDCGLDVKVLNELENFPDSVFLEDPAIIYQDTCILLKPGAKSRFGESEALEVDIKSLFEKVLYIKDGSVEGGDVLRINDHFIIGTSDRTNIKGANDLAQNLRSLGASVEISKTPEGVLHFKSDCSLLDEETIFATKKMKDTGFFDKKFRIIQVPDEEALAANTLRINDFLLIPEGFPKSLNVLSKNYRVKVLKVDEVAKVDAGLSCMSLRW